MSNKYIITGKKPLKGTIPIGGAKNSALPILASLLLTKGQSVIHNIPYVQDVSIIIEILQHLGVIIYRRADDALVCRVKDEHLYSTPDILTEKMRASICILGPLLAKRKKAKLTFPGGCVIGERPIDLHLKGLEALVATIDVTGKHIEAYTDQLFGSEILLKSSFGPTVLGTANVMMAAVLASGKTVIKHAAREPEIKDLANFLCKAGAKIKGIGTGTLEITGVKELVGIEYTIIPDRMEAGTFMIAAAATRGKVVLDNVNIDHLEVVISCLRKIGANIKLLSKNKILVYGNKDYYSCDIETLPYPGFPTDLQAPLVSFLSIVPGKSIIKENIYPSRFAYVQELIKMGASIQKNTSGISIFGTKKLTGASVVASDIRAGAALVIAALIADGETCIQETHHIKRGYESLDKKLHQLGVDIFYR